MNKRCHGLLIIFFLSTPHAFAEAEHPGKIVQKTVNDVIEVLSNNKFNEEQKRTKTYELVEKQINFTGMSRRILALNWKKASDAQKNEFIRLFRALLLDTYWNRIKKYKNQRVEYITGMIEGNNYAIIDTVIISEKVEIPITYRMEFVEGEWKAYDFLIESLSLATNYRTEYRNLIKVHGIDGVLKEMEKELQSIRGDN